MSKGREIKKINENREKNHMLEKNKKAVGNIPKTCVHCNSENIIFYDETDEEMIFQCKKCKEFFPVSFHREDLKLYFFF